MPFDFFQAVAYLLLQEALKGQMAQQVKKKEEKEQLESIPLIELLRLAAGDSQKEEQDKVCFKSSDWLLDLLNNDVLSAMIQVTIGMHNLLRINILKQYLVCSLNLESWLK